MSSKRSSGGRAARSVTRAVQGFARSGGKAGEAGLAALAVVARRNELMRAAFEDPLSADHAELARMVPEKAAAGALAGVATLHGLARAQMTLLRFWQREAQIGMQTGWRVLRAATPDAALRVQRDALASAAQRWTGLAAALTELTSIGVAGSLAPFHRRVTANARRLAGGAAGRGRPFRASGG